jgi:anti-sigma regulatory factor (Ser/Thr protein kinase)
MGGLSGDGLGKSKLVVERTQDASTVHVELESEPESLALVRAMLAGVAEQLGLDRELLDELNTTVSEACNNVVRHAYGGAAGPLIVDLCADADRVEVTIRDHGVGLDQSARADDDMRVGLPLIAALADRSEVHAHPDGGTEVRIAFNRQESAPDREEWRHPTGAGDAAPLPILGDVTGSLAPVNLLAGVLGRMARLLAARARFSLERFADLYLLFDQLAVHASRHARAPDMTFALSAETRRLEVGIGPIAGAGDSTAPDHLVQPPPHLRMLADKLTIEPVDDSLMLRVVVGGAPTH